MCFNPRPAPKNGATIYGERAIMLHIVSIHAPLRRTGRPGRQRRFWGQRWGFNPRPAPKNGATSIFTSTGPGLPQFQSTPRSEERGDLWQGAGPLWQARFQSTPRSEERGDMAWKPSKHSRYVFQSTPRSEERGDLRTWAEISIIPPGFNPRPAPKNGATRCRNADQH